MDAESLRLWEGVLDYQRQRVVDAEATVRREREKLDEMEAMRHDDVEVRPMPTRAVRR